MSRGRLELKISRPAWLSYEAVVYNASCMKSIRLVEALAPPVYLDYAATTPLHPRVLEEMLPYLTSEHGNPSSPHAFGRRTRAALDLARDRAARLLHADIAEVCFTSGGTEADNLALFGSALNAPSSRRRVVISSIEHHAVLNAAARLGEMGFDVVQIPATPSGGLDLDAADELITAETALVSVMYANNESGALLPVRTLARLAHTQGALMHTDAVQAGGLAILDPEDLGVDLLSISAHKFYGPKGAGALWVRRGVKLKPLLFGGAQERERRAGTENVAALVGFGRAADIALQERKQWLRAVEAARAGFLDTLPGDNSIRLHASGEPCLPSIINFEVAGVNAELLAMRLDTLGLAISTGAACAAGSLEPSHVLLAMGLPEAEVKSSVRVSFGKDSSAETSREAARLLLNVAEEMRSLPGLP